MTYGFGFAYKLSPKVSIGFEDRVINTFNGDQDAYNTGGSDLYNYASAKLNINLGNKSKEWNHCGGSTPTILYTAS